MEVKGRVLLHFGAVDYDARVWINGTEVGRHKGGYTSFTFDITAYVQAGANDIAVYAEEIEKRQAAPWQTEWALLFPWL